MVKGKVIGLIIFMMIVSGIFMVSSFGNNNKVSDEVYGALESGDNVRVVIKLKEVDEEKGFFIKTMKKRNNMVSSVIIDKPIKAFLQDSVPHINASVVWSVNLSGQNITGINETICIIDTGIDFTHPDLIGKVVAEYCYCSTYEGASSNCCPDGTKEDNNATDNNGHGTHVAGIAAASGMINGVAIGANIVAVKVLNSSGSGYGSDLEAGIDWCIANRIAYNISVISMSLGDDSTHDTYCNSDGTAKYINNATGKNISVIVAAGNAASGGPSSPACVENATAIGTVNDIDDSIYFQRGSLFELMAPGISINSTMYSSSAPICSEISCSGNYAVASGTSMSTPHVAGAFALFRQFFRLQNGRVPTPAEIKTTFNSTGKQINDTLGTGLNFSRIDVFAAIQSIDTSNPVVSLSSPENNTVQFTGNVSFSCSANDVQLDNITLYVWNSSGIYNNSVIQDVSGTNGILESNISDIPYGNYEWNCLAYDENNNFSFASSNFSLTMGQIATTLNSPSDNSFVNTNQTYNCSVETEPTKLLSNITFYAWNSTNDLVYNASENVNGTTNSSLFYFNFTTEQEYSWNCLSYNNESESDWADANFSVTFDITNPSLFLIGDLPADETSNSVSRTFQYNVTDTNLANCSLIINEGISLTNSSINQSINQSFTKVFTPGTYVWSINCTDLSGNMNNTTEDSFVITAVADDGGDNGGGGGGGGGGITAMTYIPSNSEVILGYTKSLAKDDKIKFTVFDGDNGEHSLTLDYVGTNSINLTIRSEPIVISLGVGQSIKLNLSSENYYDLYIKLNSIANNEADLTIQIINEKIPGAAEITGEAIEEIEEEKEEVVEIPEKDLKQTFIYAIGLILIIIAVIILLRRKSGARKKESAKKEYKKRFDSIKPKKK